VAESSQDKLPSLSQAGKYLIIVTAFFGWFFGGMHMAITSGSMRSAAKSLHIQAGGGQPTAGDQSAVNARLKQFDANGDGRLAGAEIPLAFFDANTNSVLSADEVVLANFNAKKAGVLVDEATLLKQFDANQNGQLSKDENATAHRDANDDGTLDKDAFALAHLDTDKNGELSVAEAGQAKWRVRSDADGDGAVSQSELVNHEVDGRLNNAAKKWSGFYVVAFLFGAALGGLVFGRVGDRYGRVKGMAASIFCYSGMSAVAYFVQTPEQMWGVRFLVCMGVGGMWPNGVALMSEAWAGASRPMLAGVIGTSANVGIFLTFMVFKMKDVTVDDWRWVMLLGAVPVLLGLLVLAAVPESPRWLADRQDRESGDGDDPKPPDKISTWEVFQRPLLWVTLVGILLATVPLLGGWGSSNWALFWADETGERINQPGLKADVGMARSMTGLIGSFLGGMIASYVGRRQSYFIISLVALGSAQYLFWNLAPGEPGFLLWFSVLGFFSGIYFGWLPLFLPELFVTRVRSTGAGVCFNFGRILTALTVAGTAIFLEAFNNDYARIGQITSFIYLLGAIGILLMPKGVGGDIKD
jgi:SHS family sialic acid transporter-like MFS transporter